MARKAAGKVGKKGNLRERGKVRGMGQKGWAGGGEGGGTGVVPMGGFGQKGKSTEENFKEKMGEG